MGILRIRAIGDVAVIATFGLLLCLPMLLGARREGNPGEDGRELAAWPYIPSNLAEIEAWPAAYESWFRDHFGGRESLLQVDTRIHLDVFGVSPSSQVVLGTEGWLYFTDSRLFPDRRGELIMSAAELDAWRTSLEFRSQTLGKLGVPYVFCVCPNKISVYPEHLPWWHRERPARPGIVDQLMSHLSATSSFRMIDLRPAMQDAKAGDVVYHATDSHWNDVGAYAGYLEILRGWRQQGLDLQPISLSKFDKRQVSRCGDLVPLIPRSAIPDELAWVLTPKEVLTARRIETPPELQNLPEDWGVWTETAVYESRDGAGVLLCIGDSFMWPMHPFLASHFERSVFISAMGRDSAAVAAMCEIVRPTVILEQRVERNMAYPPVGVPEALLR